MRVDLGKIFILSFLPPPMQAPPPPPLIPKSVCTAHPPLCVTGQGLQSGAGLQSYLLMHLVVSGGTHSLRAGGETHRRREFVVFAVLSEEGEDCYL